MTIAPTETPLSEPAVMRPERFIVVALIVLAALLAPAAMLFATSRYGPALAPDSAIYIQGARRIAAGEGFTQVLPTQPPKAVRITWYPPVYAALLACGKFIGMDPLPFACFVSAALLAMLIALGGAMAWHATRSLPATAAAVTVISLSAAMAEMFASALSESLFIPAVLAVLWPLAKYLEMSGERGARGWLLAAGLAAAVAAMTRYFGLILAPLGCGLILLFAQRRMIFRLADAS